MNENTHITKNAEETKKIAKEFTKQISKGDFIAFYGNLGSGKTTFIQGLAEGLGIKRRIISPTFIIVRRYNLKKGNFYHIDLYRTKSNLDVLGLGIDEILNDKNNIIALEWAEKMGKMLPNKRIDVYFEYLGDNKRKITIKYA
jgi:tRNA threonylcarbamoyladenosine biosynthesis protein TsaE